MKFIHKVPIEITLELDGGECESETLTVNGSEELPKDSLPTPQKSGYRFMGWYTDEAFETEYEDWIVTRPRTLYAKFKKEVTVTFHPNGGTEEAAQTLLSGDLINPYTPTREDYKFKGWYTDSSFVNELETGASAAEEDIDLYAKWAKIHTITFETNGGSPVEAMRVVDGEIPKINTVNTSKSGLEFLGWYTDSACENEYEADPIKGDITLYAYWARGILLHNPTIEELKQYINFELTDEYTKETQNGLTSNVRKFKVTASIKEEYLRPGLTIYNGKIEIKFTLENNQDGGWGYFENFTLSTRSGKLTYEGEYSVSQSYSAYEETTTWELKPYLSCTVYSPEETDVN